MDDYAYTAYRNGLHYLTHLMAPPCDVTLCGRNTGDFDGDYGGFDPDDSYPNLCCACLGRYLRQTGQRLTGIEVEAMERN